MKKVLVAGASGYLGRFVVKSLKEAGFHVKVLVRSKEKLNKEGLYHSPPIDLFIDEIVVGDVSAPESLNGICSDVDYVFSSVGITRQKGKATFMDVDFRGNLHLLQEAEKSKVERFMYIHVHAAENCPSALIKAKQLFVNELKQCSIPYIIINPTGYYSDMTELLAMAKKGRILLFGKGLNKMNPIHGADLAEFCVSSFSEKNTSLSIGGPQVYTYSEMAKLAIDSTNKNGKVSHIPVFLIKFMLPILKIINKRNYELFRFFFYVMTHDVVAPPYGKKDLLTFYKNSKR